MSNGTALQPDGAKLPQHQERARGKEGNNAINHSEPERSAGDAALGEGQKKVGDTASRLVRITSRRKRLLDEDNLVPKLAVDCLRYAGLLSGDEAGKTHIECRQEKIGKEEREETLIEIFSLP